MASAPAGIPAQRRSTLSLGEAPDVAPAEATAAPREDVRAVAQRSDARDRRGRRTSARPTDADHRPGPQLLGARKVRAAAPTGRYDRLGRRGRRPRRWWRRERRPRRRPAAGLDPAAAAFAIALASVEAARSRRRAAFVRTAGGGRASRRAILGTDQTDPAAGAVLPLGAGTTAALVAAVGAGPRRIHRRGAAAAPARTRGLRGGAHR